MKPKPSSRAKQGHLLYQDLLKQLNPKHPLLMLAQKLPWSLFEEEFSRFYACVGRPAKGRSDKKKIPSAMRRIKTMARAF